MNEGWTPLVNFYWLNSEKWVAQPMKKSQYGPAMILNILELSLDIIGYVGCWRELWLQSEIKDWL